ncbi:MAG: hypothetical protein Q8P27_03540 [Candidatus Peregrinibacteria bacterium]|nr:hypothetical protein [Candidatus Peregrinibacteria bacterium]
MFSRGKLEGFDPGAVEIGFREKQTGLERIDPKLRTARETSNHALLAAAKTGIAEYLLAQSENAVMDRRNQGKRYVIFSIGDCFVKVLVSEGRYAVFAPNRTELERILSGHALEHAAISHYFSGSVPDTLFFGSTIEFEADNKCSQAMRSNPFIAQDGVREPKTITEAAAGPIAEMDQFRRSLVQLLNSFVDMGDQIGLVPDISQLGHQNLLVDPTGHIWVVDTNTLVTPDAYSRLGFNFIKKVERLISQLDRGQMRGNPQG